MLYVAGIKLNIGASWKQRQVKEWKIVKILLYCVKSHNDYHDGDDTDELN